MRLALALALLPACVAPLPEPVEGPSAPLDVGETRAVEIRHLALEVDRFEKSLDLEAMRRLPPSVLDQLWLLDVSMDGLVQNALDQLAALTLTEARQLPVTAQNMRSLLRMTPDDADLAGTGLEEMVALSAALGIPKGRTLAELLEIGLTDPVIPRDLATDVLIDNLISSHPATQWRVGPVDAAHPDGRWPVARASVPVFLSDLVSGFATLAERFGPADTPLGRHPGFLAEASGVDVVGDDFRMTVRVNANALPFRGVDLGTGADAAVNSTPSQIATLFPVDDPDWLVVEGIVAAPTIGRLVVQIAEDAAFHPATAERENLPLGNNTAWDLPPWAFEHLILEMTHRATQRISPHCLEATLGTGVQAFEACVDEDGWTSFRTFNGLGNPPAPTWLWDTTLELAQVRLHDGGLAEGEANVSFALDNVPLGVDAAAIADTARNNLAANPGSLRELARVLTENTQGEADLYYVRLDAEAGAEAGDWLVFVAPDDVPLAEDGTRQRVYAQPGFFADEALTVRVSAPDPASADHQRVRIAPGDVLHVQDETGAVYRLDVREKPSRARIALDVTRIR